MRRRRTAARATISLFLVACMPAFSVAPAARASWVEPLFMPGPVSAKHAEVESKCAQCHEAFDKAAQDRLCLACHEDVAADLTAKRGFHGQKTLVRNRPCRACHTEHQGREAVIVQLDRESFEHRDTDMPLLGGHTKIPCEQCHVSGKRYREAPSSCNGCHAEKDPHERSLGTACADCHAEKAWNEVHFDHSSSAFPLQGKHRDADCKGCHPTKRYKPTASSCADCHARDDEHRGGLGSDCRRCHAPQGWPAATFDHARQTDFPLLGRHARAKCSGCHRKGHAPAETTTQCYGCHARDDFHQGRFGRACQSCHAPTQWRRATFEHARRTGFPLRGRHAEIGCAQCHRGSVQEERLPTSCYGCHRRDDVHRGREGARCKSCHDENGWSRGVLFDHDCTAFPLLGAHRITACTQCHVSSVFKEVSRECVACHEKEDVHRGRLGTRCERCHEASSFRVTHQPR